MFLVDQLLSDRLYFRLDLVEVGVVYVCAVLRGGKLGRRGRSEGRRGIAVGVPGGMEGGEAGA